MPWQNAKTLFCFFFYTQSTTDQPNGRTSPGNIHLAIFTWQFSVGNIHLAIFSGQYSQDDTYCFIPKQQTLLPRLRPQYSRGRLTSIIELYTTNDQQAGKNARNLLLK